MARPTVAIVGRPNVGKSSLFNRMVGTRQSLVDPTSGVTRDRVSAIAGWNRREFLLVDTGGLVPGTTDTMELRITDQVDIALGEADVIVFVTDAHTGVTDYDQEVARELRKGSLPSVLVVNKVDGESWESDWHEFHALGLGEPMPVSASSGRHVGDVLDCIVAALPPPEDERQTSDAVAVALLGRPNVGKSSLVNALVGRETVIVDSKPGTTRDATDTPLSYEGRDYILIDTAGLRRHKKSYKTRDSIEYFSRLRTINAIERCQVGVVLIDATEHIVKQDIEIVDQLLEAGKAVALAVNKWDLIPDKDTNTTGQFVQELRRRYPFSVNLPIVFISAETGQRVHRVLADVDSAHEQWSHRVTTSELNAWLGEMNRDKPLPASKAGFPKLNYATQVAKQPPEFVFFANDPDYVATQAKRYLERVLRERFGFVGTPIRLKFRKK